MASSSNSISVNIKYVNEVKETLTIDQDQIKTVSDLKAQISQSLSIPADQQRLIFSGKLLKDPESLSTYSLFDGCTLHLVRITPKATSATTSSTTTTSQQQQPNPQANLPPSNSNAPFQGLFPQMNQSPAPTAQGFPQMNPQQMFQSNPELMRSTLQMMQSNPELFQAIMRSNPAFSNLPPETQALFSNPEIMRLMLNPDVVGAMMGTGGGAGNAASGSANSSSPSMPFFPSQFPASSMAPGSAANPQQPPAERFAEQLEQLKQMGFYDETLNLQALTLTNGNVNAAVEWLLSRPF